MSRILLFFFFNDTATTYIYTLSLHDALPIFGFPWTCWKLPHPAPACRSRCAAKWPWRHGHERSCSARSEEHTSELQSRQYLVCRLLLEKKKIEENTTSLKRQEQYQQ